LNTGKEVIHHMEWESSLCLLCDIVSEEPTVPFRILFPSKQASSQVLLETPSFIVIPDIGPIVEGYCLIVSKRHVPAVCHLTDNELSELRDLRVAVKSSLLEVYGESISFEHGEATFANNAGACIDHAHLHIVPTSVDLIPKLVEFDFHAMEESGLWAELRSNNGYLYYEDQLSNAYFAQVGRCAQQYFRRKLSGSLTPASLWNWRDFIRYADVLNTRDKIDACITNLAPRLQDWWTQNRGK
jgi:diadenosine tetraphosphate (Ap4A) HIT family hydrolase